MSILIKLIKCCDMFSSSELLRFSADNSFRTLAGGIFSLLIFVLVSISLASNIQQTFNKSKIDISSQIIRQSSPQNTMFNLGSSQSNFMFAVSVTDMLHNPIRLNPFKRYFDIFTIKTQMSSGIITKRQFIKLQYCTKQHWSAFSQIQQGFQRLQMKQWLCPSKGSSFNIQGSITSQNASVFTLAALPCSNATNYGSSVCASQNQTNSFFSRYSNMQITFYFTNPIFNLGNKQSYITYSLYEEAISVFSKQIGSTSVIYMSDYTIKNDNSFMPFPFEDISTVNGVMLDGNVQNRPHYIHNASDYYVKLILMKSNNYLFYTRTVQKISAVLSYIGGFFGALTTSLFILKLYTDLSLQMTIILSIFRKQNGQPASKIAQNFNLLQFIRIKYYRFLQLIGLKSHSQQIKQIMQMHDQINEQMDISIIIKRLINLEKLMTFLFKDQQLDYINLYQQVSLDMIKKLKTKLGFQKLFSKNNIQANNKIQNIFQMQQQKKKRSIYNKKSNVQIIDMESCNQSIFKSQCNRIQINLQQSSSVGFDQKVSKTTKFDEKLKKLIELRKTADKCRNSSQLNFRIWNNLPQQLKKSVIKKQLQS